MHGIFWQQYQTLDSDKVSIALRLCYSVNVRHGECDEFDGVKRGILL